MTSAQPGVRHLDPASGILVGLAGNEATVSLSPLPAASAAAISPSFELPPGPVVTAAAATSGDLYLPDPGGRRVLHWTSCDASVGPVECFGEPLADGSAGLDTPVAAAITPTDRLFVADAERRAVMVVDAPSGQLLNSWDLAPLSPIALALDASGRVYVGFDGAADGRTVRRYDRSGREDETFALAGPAVSRPVALGMTQANDAREPLMPGFRPPERLVVLNAPPNRPARLRSFDLDGAGSSDISSMPATVPPDARSFAIEEGRFFVATPDRVVAYDGDGREVGSAVGLSGPIRSVVVDCHGHLLVVAGAPARLIRVVEGTTWTTHGSFTVFVDLGATASWHHLDLLDVSLPARTHLRVFTCSTDTGVIAPTLEDGDVVGPDAVIPAALGRWRAHPPDETSMRVLVAPGSRLTISGRLEGDGSATPTVGLLRVAYDRGSWLRFLPAIYEREDAAGRPALADPNRETVARERAEAAFLERVLAFLERSLDESSERIDELPVLFDAGAAPDAAGWLDWLAGWLALELDATWPTPRRRAAVAEEFELAGIRGTARGVARIIQRDTGVVAAIDEPSARAVIWSLGQTSVLGFTTMVAPAEAAGALLDTTAVVDGSHLIAREDYGSPLFEDLVGRVCVRIRPPVDRTAVERRVRALLDAELPAHTAYHLCFTEPAMRVGAQAIVGLNSIVAGSPPDLVADGSVRLGVETVLPASPASNVSLGTGARVGHDAVVQ